MKPLWIVVLVLCLGVSAGANEPTTPALKETTPFRVGETVIFSLKWASIPVGHATFEVMPMTEIASEPAWHFRMRIHTNSFADKIYKIRDRLESYVAADLTRSIHFTKRQREGGRKRNITVTYDWDANTVQWVNDDDVRAPIDLKPGTFDELGFFYIFRRFVLTEGLEASLPVTDGKKYIPGSVRVVRREPLELGGKTYDTWLLEPDLSGLGGVFENDDSAAVKLWVSADDACLPLKIASKLKIGTFSAELKSLRRGDDAETEEIAPDDKGGGLRLPGKAGDALPDFLRGKD